MKNDKNIVSIVGTRPNFIKLAPVYHNLAGKINHKIIHTGQHYDFEMSDIFFKEFKLPVPEFNLSIGSAPPSHQIGEMMKRIEDIFNEHEFELVIVYGDTNSTLAGALAASKANLKLAHVEAGIRSFDRSMPEEINRILTDNLSDYLFAPTDMAVENIKNADLPGQVYQTGDLSVETLQEYLPMSEDSRILTRLNIDHDSYILFTMHRAENTLHSESLLSIIKVMERITETMIVFPIHPRTKGVLELNNLYKRISSCKNVKIIEPIGYVDFVQLARNSTKIVTDSSGIQKESYLLSIPCVTLRNNTEWVETVHEGWNKLVGTDSEKIIKAILEWFPHNDKQKQIFGNGNTSKVISDKILEAVE